MSGYADSAHVSPAKKDLQNDSEPPVYFKPSDIPPNYEDSQAHCEAEQRFVSQRVWNDVWAIVFYYLNFLFFCGLCGFGIYTLIDRNDEGVLLTFKGKTISNDNLTNSTVENALTVKMISTALPVAIGISVVMTFIYGLIVYFFTVAMIVISYFFSVVIFLGCGAYLIYLRAYVAGGILCGVGMLVALMFCCIYSRIGFTAQLIKTVMLVVSRYPSITLVPIVAMFLQIGVALLWGYGLSGCKLRFGSNTGGMIGISIFLIFSFFWNAQFINNSLHTACSGVFCAYYFLGETVQMPKRPVKIAIRNAVGPGSGSIALGSLIVAIIQTLRTVVKLLAGKNSNAVMQCISCFLNCILGAVEATAKYFNRYAFVLVSIYGKSFYQSAKACVTLFAQKGFDAIINDNMAENVLFLGGAAVGILSGVGGWLVATEGNTINSGNFGLIVGLICGAIGFFIFSVMSGMISSGIASIFVCLAEDPRALLRTKPDLYEKFRQVYPDIEYPVM